ncbi:MAG: TonB-linked outer membrane protein, SusC/RagA family [Bacteroidetes bacterium]|nr:TonB-linked outer membrane protein, SusC/RagA family [Bacteroidota bacterium]
MTRKTIVFIFTFFSFFLANDIFAQSKATISGRITDDKKIGLELVNVGIINLKNPIGTTTNRIGNYSFEVPANQELELAISYIGYATKLYKLRLKPNEHRVLDFSLVVSNTTLGAIEIKEDNSRSEGITRIKTEWAKNIIGPSSGIEGLVKTFEGVSSNNELSSQYSVRGGNYDENLVYVNDIEIFRPFLIRSGQQEGLSFINSDMVGDILFSSGGFDSKYGDKLSSVLDIKYKKPQEFSGSASASLLGGSVHLEGLIGSRMTYQIGYRNKTNKYILGSMDTEGSYYPVFNDLQVYTTYDLNEKTELAFLGNISDNKYQFIPRTRETSFGNVYEVLKLKVYFDGQELDRFSSAFGAFMLTHNPVKDLQLKFITSFFATDEKESYDIQGQYWLYETGLGGSTEEDPGFDRGIGTYIEHARNRLVANIYNFEHKGRKIYSDGTLSWGAKYQLERIQDKMNEWKMVDSSGTTVGTNPDIPGDTNLPASPMLQNIFKSNNEINSSRISAYIQRQWNWEKEIGTWYLNTGARSQYWSFNDEVLFSPRASVSLKPNWKKDWLFRFATGVYSQSPFFREYRDFEGDINYDIKSQKSLHFVLSSDYNFKMFNRPFKFLAASYYKYLWDLIPYSVDNVRIRYSAQNNSKGYVTGLDLRLFGEFIEGIDSWVTMSIMQTKEDIKGDGHGYIPRPTDQLFNMNVSFNDYIPSMPYIRVYLNFNFGTGYPFGAPNSERWQQTSRMPNYMRADIAFTFRLKDEDSKWAQKNFMRHIKKIWLNVEWFNVFGNQNTISYMWISDFDNKYYGVPNYLTPSQLNAKLTFEF